MTDRDILFAALDKAIDNGYDLPLGFGGEMIEINEILKGEQNIADSFVYKVHFAKAFFKDKPNGKDWFDHLMKLVGSIDPIRYLEKYL